MLAAMASLCNGAAVNSWVSPAKSVLFDWILLGVFRLLTDPSELKRLGKSTLVLRIPVVVGQG